MNHHFLFICCLVSLLACQPGKPLPTVEQLDISRYAGTWHEIARLPNSFEKGMDCVTATYTLLEDGVIEVRNQGILIEEDNKVKDIVGSAKIPDPAYPGRLKVTFFKPFYGDYYVMELDEDYQYALVGSPSRQFLWVLARDTALDQGIYTQLLETAEQEGFAVGELYVGKQDCK